MIQALPMNIDKESNKLSQEKWAIVTLSKDGVTLAENLVNYLDDKEVDIYTKEKYSKEFTKLIETDIHGFMGKIMAEYQIICCIMATGIVVRAIAPYLEHKSDDPGILVMDTRGDYVISLLSGHLGGANEAARLIAKRFGSQAVITTGTDVKGTMAVDVLAEKINCTIDNFTEAKDVTALILNEEPVGILNKEAIDLEGIVLPSNIRVLENASEIETCSGIIYTSIKEDGSFDDIPSVKLVPKKIILGIGCRRNTSGKRIIEAIEKTLEKLDINKKGIKILATIGLKEDEPGIDEALEYFKGKKVIVPDAMVQMVQSRFEASDFVYKTTGLYAVSEPCGYIASGFGTCLLEKQKLDGITLSVWYEEN